MSSPQFPRLSTLSLPTPTYTNITTHDASSTRIDLQLCNVCYLHFVLQKNVSLLKTNFGTLDEIFHRRPCLICDYLYAILRKQINVPLARRNDNVASKKIGCWIRTYIMDPTEILVIYDGVMRFRCQLIVDRSWKQQSALDAVLAPRLRNWSYHGDGSLINPRWVSGFIDSCCGARAVHDRANGCGSNHMRLSDARPMKLILIDVRKLCLVQADTTSRYCSLSYVWGGAQVLRTTSENLEVLMRPGALEKLRPAPVVQDAIELSRSIGVRYLWVDGLCIPQDDGVLTAFYINRMDYIYSQSVLTVVAASSTSSMDRLPGVRTGSRTPQQTPKIGNMRVVRRTQELGVHLDDVTYEGRAWSKPDSRV
jgi:hypothetical protein